MTAQSICRLLFLAFLSACLKPYAQAQTPASATAEVQLRKLASRLSEAEEHLKQSQQEMEQLHEEIATLRAEVSRLSTPPVASLSETPRQAAAANPSEISSKGIADVKEQLAVVQSQVEQHEQVKVESVSKYPVRIGGLILFNAFSNHGAVDNFDQPAVAVPSTSDTPSKAYGASLRQTIIGVEATGPHLAGARSYAEVNMDFYGGIQYTNYGSTGGIVRMRTALARLQWNNDTAEAGLVAPLISPLSPTSYASVAEPAMAWAGNLWTWAPQLRYEHRFTTSSEREISWEFGLWDPPPAGYTNADGYRVASPGERSGQPAYESRIAWKRGIQGSPGEIHLGLGGYYSRMAFSGGRNGDSYALTGDWALPITHRLELSGEAYRGRAIGGLGGGVYKNVVTGADPITGASTFRLLNDAGGWAQAKVRFTNVLEANGAFGLDNGFARDFHSLIIPSNASALQLRARNQMWSANLIYSPKTYLILSPEFRHIRTFSIDRAPSSADIFTLSLGYRF